MPVKNSDAYIAEAIKSLQEDNDHEWELIVVDDHSTDKTADIVQEMLEQDNRIKYKYNNGVGKNAALNLGYLLASGYIINFLDSDDKINRLIFNFTKMHEEYDVICHGSFITDRNMNIIGKYSLNTDYLKGNFYNCLENLRSIPRCMWSFTRIVGDKVFPIPEYLPFEDVWFSLVIKKYGFKIFPINDYLYYYRQHDNQDHGGIYNFSKEIIIFRANRMLNMIKIFENEERHDFYMDKDRLKKIKLFYTLMANNNISLMRILFSNITFANKIKLVLFKRCNSIVDKVMKLKWKIDKIRSNQRGFNNI